MAVDASSISGNKSGQLPPKIVLQTGTMPAIRPVGWSLVNAVSKKYQMFVSSTFKDLVEERKAIINAVLDLDHIPSGMELFPSADMEQFEYIKRMIDACDYYILVVGSRYGQVDGDGISFTEREFDYAVEKKKIVLAFIQRDGASEAGNKVDIDQAAAKRLENFKTKVTTGRLVTFWTSLDNLMRNFMQSVARATRDMPAIGWVRADTVASEDLLRQINELRIENIDLRAKSSGFSQIKIDEKYLAGLHDSLAVEVEVYGGPRDDRKYFKTTVNTTLGDLFKYLSPNLVTRMSRVGVDNFILQYYKENFDSTTNSVTKSYLDTLRIQLVALDLVIQFIEDGKEYYKLSNKGFERMFGMVALLK